MVAPRSLEEIRQALEGYHIMDNTSSDDILRIDLNTIKAMGCEVSRASKKTNGKYVLYKHPFDLKLNDKEIGILRRVYNRTKEQVDISTLFDFDNLFKKIAYYVCDSEQKEKLLGISVLRHFDIDWLKQLYDDCIQQRIINLTYKKPTSKEISNKKIKATKLIYQNDKIFLYGYDVNKGDFVVLNALRIIEILSKEDSYQQIKTKDYIAKYAISTAGVDCLTDSETIIEENESTAIVEGRFLNEFYATQRMLSFGLRCKVLEPQELKDSVIAKLKEMRDVYEKNFN